MARILLRLGIAAVAALALAGCTTPGTPTTPAGSTPAPSGPSAPGTSKSPNPVSSIPADLLLPNEGERSTQPEFTDWTTDDAVDQAWLLDPCMPTAYPTDQQRTRFRTVSQTGPEAHDARQLAVYPSAEVATEALAGFRRALAACSIGTTRAGSRWQWVSEDVPTLGDEGLVAGSTVGGGEFSPTGNRIAVTRVGDVVFLAYGAGEFSTAALDGGAGDAQAVAQEFLDSL